MKLLAELKEGARISTEAIRSNMLRSVLTTIGIVIGIVTVTLMAAAMEAMNSAFQQAISFIGTDVLYIDRRQWFVGSDQQWESMGKRSKITVAQARALERQLSGVRGVAPTITHGIDSIEHGDRSSTMVNLIGTTEQYMVTSGVTIATGRFMTKAEANGARDVCVIGADIAEKLFDGAALGRKLRVREHSVEVIGVLEKRGALFGQISLDNQVIIPIGKMIRRFRWDASCTIEVKVGDPARVETAREELRGVMRRIRKVPPGQDDDFAINQQEQLRQQFGKVST
jgi:putative ABC transport system permease protein